MRDKIIEAERALQWGRNLSVAEGSRRRPPASRHSSFNGAATFRLRKVNLNGWKNTTAPCFNGAATFRLRKVQGRRREYRCSKRFNGAATFRLRKGGRARNRPRPNLRFNGAATFRLRKVKSDLEVPLL